MLRGNAAQPTDTTARALQAAASMAVHVGSNADPEEIPGLAHFCEHMLFREWGL